MPEPEMISRQREKLELMHKLKRDGYGWEDIFIRLREAKFPTPADQIRNFVLRPQS
jgi:hypothetical protein